MRTDLVEGYDWVARELENSPTCIWQSGIMVLQIAADMSSRSCSSAS